MPGRLQGKIAIVTGASSGIGRAIALAYSAEGAKVVCADLRPESRNDASPSELLATTHDTITSSGGSAIFVQADLGEAEDVARVVARAPKPVGEVSPEDWDKTQHINSKGVFLGIKYASAQMLKQDPLPSDDRGWIINTASILGLVGATWGAAYCASKGLVVNLTRAAPLECAPHRIHMNAIAPGYTESKMMEAIAENPEREKELEKAHPFRGLGRPEDLAKVCVFLASEDAQWVTGVTIPVDGDYTAR
ncbi:hypothetical protein B0A48_15932 [Cryoendolithus antarcticus]|uniref:Uncharacterized protein n=1 Tax=Cryoendolithus antarcticus TaxID=1507870 RepID=A0A1V8SGJ0_9PEZI|nr:hypothetical protein B0A48_15932 [Cryoendolithus antarcticus]